MAKRVLKVEEGALFTGLGCTIRRLAHPSTVGSEAIQMSHVVQNPGEVVPRHRHAAEEVYFVLSGTGVLTMDAHPDVHLEKDLCVYVPGDVIHGHVNTGAEPLVMITAMSPPLGPDSITFER